MKIFKVKIDNNPGGWKSGEDPSVLVVAKDKEDALQKVKNGWGDKWGGIDSDGVPSIIYSQTPPDKGYSLVREDSILSAMEIIFEGYDVHIKNPRQAKLDRIQKNIEREIEKNLLTYTSDSPLLRKLMSKDEIKVANRLVKEGRLQKGISDDKQQTIVFYV